MTVQAQRRPHQVAFREAYRRVCAACNLNRIRVTVVSAPRALSSSKLSRNRADYVSTESWALIYYDLVEPEDSVSFDAPGPRKIFA